MLGPKSTALNEERKTIRAELEGVPPPAELIALHPAILARYELQLERLQESLASCVASGDREATLTMRDLIQSVTVLRDNSKQGGVIVEIAGRLNTLLGENAYPNRVKGVWGSLVAEECFIRSPPIAVCHSLGGISFGMRRLHAFRQTPLQYTLGRPGCRLTSPSREPHSLRKRGRPWSLHLSQPAWGGRDN